MNKIIAFLFLAALVATPAYSALNVGATAPDFVTQASLGGKVFTYSLADALKKGPVVLYFFPVAFGKGCSKEAHKFADAIDKYHALGATVIGVSHDDIETLSRFSVISCRGKFPVAMDNDQSIMRSYDAILATKPEYANRTSYVISPAGKIIYTYTDLQPEKHVANTLEALRKWAAEQKPN